MAEANIFSTPCIPKFDGDYDHWSLLMENLLRSKEYWSVVESGFTEPKENEPIGTVQQKALDDARLKDLQAKNYLFQAIDKSILKTITHKETTKQMWDSMKVKFQGNARVKRAHLQRLRRTFDLLTVDELQSSLLIHEHKIRERRSEEQVLQVEQNTRKAAGKGRHNYQRGRGNSVRGCGRGRSFVYAFGVRNRDTINLNVLTFKRKQTL